MATERQKALENDIRKTADLRKELEELYKLTEEMTKARYFGSQTERGKKIIKEMNDEFKKIYNDADKNSNKIIKPFMGLSKLAKSGFLGGIFDTSKVENAQKKYKENVTLISRQQKAGQIGVTKSVFKQIGAFSKGIGSLVGSLSILKKLKLPAISLLDIFNKFKDAIIATDEAIASVASTSGILDNTLNKVLIEATQNASLVGGNIKRTAEFANELFSELSPSIPLTSKLLGNVTQIGERFGFSTAESSKFLRIVAQSANLTFEQASIQLEGFTESLGRIGPAVVRNLVKNFDQVNDRFVLGVDLLKEQVLQATQLGIELSAASKVADGLLNFQKSLTDEFTASAIIGKTINLQKARQLSFEKDIVGATNAVLDEVEKIGNLTELDPFQAQALAEAANLTVSELQKELRIRREIGTLGKVDAATRETALGRIEGITRRIQAVFFNVLASPTIQQVFNNLANVVETFLKSGGLEKLVNKISGLVDGLGRLLGGGGVLTNLSIGGFNVPIGIGGGAQSGGRLNQVNDAIITPRGEVVKTNPRDFIIATQNPQQLTSEQDSVIMGEMLSLLKNLNENGVKSTTYLDGKQVSRQMAMSNRY